MNLLLDTHVVLWWLDDDVKLPSSHRTLISDPDNICYVSAATVWEISIKSALGKLRIPEGYTGILESEGFIFLNITCQHCDKVRFLPLIHRDPFDRLLIAQAQLEDLIMLTVDSNIQKYDIRTM